VDFDALYDEVFPPLYRYCQRLIGDPDAAEDVAQEAFVRLLDRKVEGERPALRVWLFTVATHLIRDRWRVTRNRGRLLQINPVTPGAAPDPEAETARRQEVMSVRQALDELDERDRQLLLMREEGFSYREIAEVVGVNASSVGTLLARAQKRFTDAWTSRLGSAPHPLARGEAKGEA
jgi:RNA polymerase sigma factor (sigma-70 family)